jgi:flagellar biosynthesis/type III secretory pathway protein FliH
MTHEERERWAYAEGDVRLAQLLRERPLDAEERQEEYDLGYKDGRREGYQAALEEGDGE